MSIQKWAIALAITILFSISPGAALASAAPYGIAAYDAYITIQPDGSVVFDKYITYRLHGQKAEAVKAIPISDTTGMMDLEVFYLDESEGQEDAGSLRPLTLSADGALGEDRYRLTYEGPADEWAVIAVELSGRRNQTFTFVYRYTLRDLIFIYRDTAALFWPFVPPYMDTPVDHFEAVITVLGSDETQADLEGYLRGAVYTEKAGMGTSTIWFSAKNITPEEYLEAVVLLPVDQIPQGRKIIDNFAREGILNQYMPWESEAEQIRQETQFRRSAAWTLAGLASLLILAMGLFLFMYLGRRPGKTSAKAPASVFSEEMAPAEIGGVIGPKAILATVLTLIRSGCLIMSMDEKGGGRLTLYPEFNKSALKPHEEYLLDWLIKDLGNGSFVSLEQLHAIFVDLKTSDRLQNKVATWACLVRPNAGKRKPGKSYLIGKGIGAMAAVLGFASAYMAGILLRNSEAGILSAALSLLLLAYVLMLKKQPSLVPQNHTQGADEYVLRQLSRAPSKMLLKEWEHVFPYALPLGMEAEALRSIIERYPEQAFEDGNLTYLHQSNLAWLQGMIEAVTPKGRRR